MTCSVCGRHVPFHGSELGSPHSAEFGCYNGVIMDDDEHAEGWQDDVVYRPCSYSPFFCKPCKGSGCSADGDCPSCKGTGWIGEPQYPVRESDLVNI